MNGRVAYTLLKEKRYFSYRGIPYADKPIDDEYRQNRFKAPVEIKKLPDDPYDATEYKLPCSQSPEMSRIAESSEGNVLLTSLGNMELKLIVIYFIPLKTAST